MTTYTKKVLKLRTAVIAAGILTMFALFAPTFVMVHDAYAQPATQPTATAPATPAATSATAPVVATKVAPAAPAAAAPAVVAPAAPAAPETQAWWQALLVPVLGIFGMFLAAFLSAGLLKVVKLIEAKWKIDIPDSVEKLMTEKARWALAWVEEKAEKRLLHGDGKKTSGAEKIGEVTDLLQKFADGLGYGHEWQKDKIEGLAEGVLHLERDKNIGSSGERATALTAKKTANA